MVESRRDQAEHVHEADVGLDSGDAQAAMRIPADAADLLQTLGPDSGTTTRILRRGNHIYLQWHFPTEPLKHEVTFKGTIPKNVVRVIEIEDRFRVSRKKDDYWEFGLREKYRVDGRTAEIPFARVLVDSQLPSTVLTKAKPDCPLWVWQDYARRRVVLSATAWNHILDKRGQQIGDPSHFRGDLGNVSRYPIAAAEIRPEPQDKGTALMYVACSSDGSCPEPIVDLRVLLPNQNTGYVKTAIPTDEVARWKWIDGRVDVDETRGARNPCGQRRWSSEEVSALARLKRELEGSS